MGRIPRIAALVCAIVVASFASAPLARASTCGDGIVDGAEECDPGGPTTVGATASGAPCTSGGACFFVQSGGCCKFNCQAVGSGLACDDGNACSVGEHCNNVGVCECSGGCDPAAAAGSVCRVSTGECDPAEICQAGTGCPADQKSSPGTSCTDDGNTCTRDQCNGTSALCQHPAGNAGTICRPSAGECDPAETCTGSSTTCPAESNPNGTPCTDDGNACTNDICDGGGGCGHPANTAPCNDGSFCNGTDTCAGGTCSQHNGDPCASGSECQTGPCDEINDSCVSPAGSSCGSDGNPCTDDVCNGSGICGVANTAACNDGVFCNGADTCNAGSCGSHAGDPCAGGSECADLCNEATDQCFDPAGTACTSDGNVCTDDQCNGSGSCAHSNNTASCDDGVFCNGADSCSAGGCAAHAGDPCAAGTECADTCNESLDNCFDSAGVSCSSDGNVCTDDLCNGSGSCGHPANTAPCDDVLFCNGTDTCGGGSCSVHSGDPCSGGGECADSCNESVDNCYDPSGAACATDGNVCTDDQCNGAGACAHPNNTAPCDDAVFCNGSDVCSGGTCSGHAGDPCASGSECADTCNEAVNNCYDAIGTSCASDSNVCTDDQCDGIGACAHTSNVDPCDDGQFCTVNDVCAAGSCGGSTRSCDDSNDCTSDSCDESGNQCSFVATAVIGTTCDDNNVCTLGTSCDSNGQCGGGSSLDCDDGILCTADTCQPVTGCQHVAGVDTRSCGDGCDDGIDNEGDGNVDFEDPGCTTLHTVQRFAVVSTNDASRKALYAGSDVTIAGVDADGICDAMLGQCVCAVPGPVACVSLGRSCTTNAHCVTSIAGQCNLTLNVCECPAVAPDCQPKDRPCVSDSDCAPAPYPLGDAHGGVCGHGMEVRAGTHIDAISAYGRISFGKGSSADRHLDIAREFGSSGGTIVSKISTPLVGAPVCSSDLNLTCDSTTVCPPAPTDVCVVGQCSGHAESCLSDTDCEPACDARRRLDDGTCSHDASVACMFDSECGGGNQCDHPFVFTDGSSDTWQRCAQVLELAPDKRGVSQELYAISAAIAAYVPSGSESVPFPASCQTCPEVGTSFGDVSCAVCPATGEIRAGIHRQKYGITLGGGLQILDLYRLDLPDLSELHFLGQADTVLVIRLTRGIRLGAETKVVLGSNGNGQGSLLPDNVLWNLATRFGGPATMARKSQFSGTILAPERSGVRIGGEVELRGAVLARKIVIKQTTRIDHVPFTALLPIP